MSIQTWLRLGLVSFILSTQPSAQEIPKAIEVDPDTPVMFLDSFGPLDISKALPWKAPDYSGQESALGYGPDAFAIPKGMEERVAFWVDIYTKYTSDQGVLHDSLYVHLVYEPVDFGDIMKNSELSLREQARARKMKVDEAKIKIKERLERLQTLSGPEGLEGEDLRIWNLFEKVEGKNKFLEASRVGRLRFQLGQKDRFVQGIYQSGRYIQEMEQIFTEMGMPRELIRMVFVESSFNLKARSRVGASGIWQFMRSTGRQYMRLDSSVDERNDPLRATQAAARKLRHNYQMLESWPLAVTGYNHGPSGIRRMVQRVGSRDLAELTDVRKGRFGFASASFYASFLAALQVEREASKYFGPVLRMPPLQSKELKLSRNLSTTKLIEWFDGNSVMAQEYNPHIQPHVWRSKASVSGRSFVRLLPEKFELAQTEVKNLKETFTPSNEGIRYEVGMGDTLSQIAEKFGVSQRAITELNGIGDPRSLRAGQVLLIPQTAGSL